MQELKYKTFILFCLLIPLNLKAQVEPPTLMPGLAFTYANKFDAAGINTRLYYAADHHYWFGPEVSYFKNTGEDFERSLVEANVNLHYIIDLKSGLGVYPLGGINYTVEKEIKKHNGIEEKYTEDAFGLNIGGGLHYANGRFLFFGEYKYVVSELNDSFFTIGTLINFSLAKDISQKH